MELLGNTENKIDKDENGENMVTIFLTIIINKISWLFVIIKRYLKANFKQIIIIIIIIIINNNNRH